ncbi:DUF4129 domain-containing protein [Pantanalinema sp. GBBB05]|uniref:DUF4129 domain-containing protein n=1 Tax=Pantanalinema sp. GBBB05 TaxID=2604139 RepID=UPI003D812893
MTVEYSPGVALKRYSRQFTASAKTIAHNGHNPLHERGNLVFGSYEKNSIGWQIQQLQQRLSEWWERLTIPSGQVDVPDWSLPEWLFRSVFWSIAVVLAVWVSFRLYQLLRPYLNLDWLERPQAAAQKSSSPTNLTVAEWLHRSHTLAQQGNYREACRAIYLATLQQLHDIDLIPNQPSRTDGEYLDILQAMPDPQPYEVLMQTHEQLCFSNSDVSREAFERCQHAYQAIEPRQQE